MGAPVSREEGKAISAALVLSDVMEEKFYEKAASPQLWQEVDGSDHLLRARSIYPEKEF